MTTDTRFRVFANFYKDSVALMQVGAALRKRPGIVEASCVMATPANLEQLANAKLSVDAKVNPSDLLIVVRGEAQACDEALDAAQSLLQSEPTGGGESEAFSIPLTSIAAAVEQTGDADLALISVPGDYAAAEAMKALSLGLHVMLFSDNVDVDQEFAVKKHAEARGLLVMGPDCGTAIINGIPLGFANVVRRGSIGLVAASGTGLQEVTCRIHNLGAGVSQAIGTGGRDLRDEIGGLTMLAGLRALAGDDQTRVIVLISKPPSPKVAARILALAAASGRPTVVHFLGAEPGTVHGAGLHAAQSLADAADIAVALAKGGKQNILGTTLAKDSNGAEHALDGLASTQSTVRGLFTGGTFCYEAQLAFLSRGLPCRSNAPVHGALPLEQAGGGHVFIDMGDDEYTRGRPHPMIDPSLRNAAIREAADDPALAVLLFDLVLGYGSHPSPADELADALRDAQRTAARHGRKLATIGHVCGTDSDPQDRAGQIETLASTGAIIAGSNIEAASIAAQFAMLLAKRNAGQPR
ncbi:MAG TPA: acyl-CoA synthetase FdrA [Casimicrobiaceae bacterium]|nr:acyl-CoA synthetase FdrA [Casimicrobiaceae bacterium]